MKKNKKTKIPPALRLIFLVICGAILGVNVYMANANSLVGNQLPTPFGYGAAVVLSGSMEPEFSKGDLIIVRETDIFLEKDIVVYQDGESLVVHRIIEVEGETVTTKGDANDTADAPISASAIKGKVIFHIPFVGNIVSALKTPLGTVCTLIAAIALVEIPRRREKESDNAEKQKIIDEINRLRAEQAQNSAEDNKYEN